MMTNNGIRRRMRFRSFSWFFSSGNKPGWKENFYAKYEKSSEEARQVPANVGYVGKLGTGGTVTQMATSVRVCIFYQQHQQAQGSAAGKGLPVIVGNISRRSSCLLRLCILASKFIPVKNKSENDLWDRSNPRRTSRRTVY